MPPWSQTPLGGYLIAWEQAQLDTMLADIFGYNALQVGFAETNLLRASRMLLHVCAARAPQNATSASKRLTVISDEAALPFADASLDLVVLAHELEFSAIPHQLLREAGRVLVPEGSVVICGFNPYSLWGLRRRPRDQWPWKGRYFSAAKVRDWLTVLGFEVQPGRFGCYAPAVSSPEWLNRWKWLDRVGRRCWPMCGAAWILHGIKRVHGTRLIQPNWRKKRSRTESLPAVARKLGDTGGLPDQQ
ncbi:MAG: methyltransferase domain-containing protein [Azoarcus sp.]|jgi:SAM-dependent methyltransferase|nr:methyltransferase domain-containing protein [Azoarcus sp.]